MAYLTVHPRLLVGELPDLDGGPTDVDTSAMISTCALMLEQMNMGPSGKLCPRMNQT